MYKVATASPTTGEILRVLDHEFDDIDLIEGWLHREYQNSALPAHNVFHKNLTVRRENMNIQMNFIAMIGGDPYPSSVHFKIIKV